MSIKTFVPIMLIVICSALVFYVRPRYIEGRIGLGITALLTLVALQLASGSSLPDVDYLMMLDKIYLLAYIFIIIALARVVATSWRTDDAQAEKAKLPFKSATNVRSATSGPRSVTFTSPWMVSP